MADVYVAGSLRHTPREWHSIYEEIGAVVESAGLTAHVPHVNTVNDLGLDVNHLQDPNFDLEIVLGARSRIYERNLEVVHNSKLIIAEVTDPSTGTGIEIGWALKLNKPVICLAHKDANVTSMVLGPAQLGLVDFIWYENVEDALSKLKNLLENKFRGLRK